MASSVFGLALGVTGLAGGVSVSADGPQAFAKIFICHATGSETAPYEKIEVDQNALNGHVKDDSGPVWYAGAKAADVVWGDIVPPVAGVARGLNWTAEGQAIYNNDCEVPVTGVSPEDGTMPATGSGSSEILLLGGVSVALGTMLLGFRRKLAIR